MNNNTTTPNQRITLISKNGGVHVGWVAEKPEPSGPKDRLEQVLEAKQQTKQEGL